MADIQPLAAFVLLTALMAAAAVGIVPEYRRLAVYRLGRCIGEPRPGLVRACGRPG